jgi:hypothetical protein
LVEHDDGTLRVIKPEHLLAPLRGPGDSSPAVDVVIPVAFGEQGGAAATGSLTR